MAAKGLNTTKQALNWDALMEVARQEIRSGDRDLGLYIAISLYTGLRCNEILSLKMERFYKDDKMVDYLDIFQSKTQKSRRITISLGLKTILETCNRHSGYIVRGRTNRAVTKQWLNTKLKTVGKKHGITTGNEMSSHALRKTFARRVMDKNPGREEWALVLLSDIFGHSSTAMTRRYLGIRQAELDGAYNCLT